MQNRKFIGIGLSIGVLCVIAFGAGLFLEETLALPVLDAQEGEVRPVRTAFPEEDRTEQNVLMEAAKEQSFVQAKQGNESFGLEQEGGIRAELRVPGASYPSAVTEGVTVYDLMTAVAAQFDFDFRGKSFWGLGFYVQEINGLAENPKKKMRWIYYINGETALVGVSQYTVQPNDIIEWKYEAEH